MGLKIPSPPSIESFPRSRLKERRTMKKHHRYSPSQLVKFAACPCYRNDPTIVSSAAEAGRRLHEAVQYADLDRCESDFEKELVVMCLAYRKEMTDQSQTQGHELFVELDIEVEDLTAGTADLVI